MKKAVNNKKTENKSFKKLYSVITGILAGLINGIFGGGGGMIVVPMLVYLLGWRTKKAHATAILIILPLSIVSGLCYSVFGNVNIDVVIPVGIGVILGGVIGALALSKLSSRIVVMIFSIIMAVAGLKMLLF